MLWTQWVKLLLTTIMTEQQKKNLKRLKFTWWLIWIYAFLFYFLTMETVVDRKKLVLHVRLY